MRKVAHMEVIRLHKCHGREPRVIPASQRLATVLVLTGLLAYSGCKANPTHHESSVPLQSQTGVIVIEPQFRFAVAFSEGLAAVRIGDAKTGKWGCIDKTGHFAVNPQFDFVGPYSQGPAAVRLGDDMTGKWGYIRR